MAGRAQETECLERADGDGHGDDERDPRPAEPQCHEQRRDELPPDTRTSIESALAATADGDRMRLNIAFNYAGRTELVDAVRSIIRRGLSPDEVDEATIAAALYTAGLPDPDLVIRTGGEHRLSNFLIWQSAYAELIMSDTLWPDFGPADMDQALAEYASRTRRFGR